MQSYKFSVMILLALTVHFSIPAFADSNANIKTDSKTESMFGLPGVPTNSSTTLGALPYSNQWISEQIKSYMYFSYNSAQMNNPNISVGQYTTQFDSNAFGFLSIDYFSKILPFASPESSKTVLRELSLWGRYSLGFAARKGDLTNTQTALSSSNDSSLLLISARLGALVGYDHFAWFKPYLGVELDPSYYRTTSDLNGAESQNEQFSYGPVLGSHFPILFSGRGSLFTEVQKNIPIQNAAQIMASSYQLTAGMGFTF